MHIILKYGRCILQSHHYRYRVFVVNPFLLLVLLQSSYAPVCYVVQVCDARNDAIGTNARFVRFQSLCFYLRHKIFYFFHILHTWNNLEFAVNVDGKDLSPPAHFETH